jgi:hypothetical protein
MADWFLALEYAFNQAEEIVIPTAWASFGSDTTTTHDAIGFARFPIDLFSQAPYFGIAARVFRNSVKRSLWINIGFQSLFARFSHEGINRAPLLRIELFPLGQPPTDRLLVCNQSCVHRMLVRVTRSVSYFIQGPGRLALSFKTGNGAGNALSEPLRVTGRRCIFLNFSDRATDSGILLTLFQPFRKIVFTGGLSGNVCAANGTENEQQPKVVHEVLSSLDFISN